jgi:hypothetical protein
MRSPAIDYHDRLIDEHDRLIDEHDRLAPTPADPTV